MGSTRPQFLVLAMDIGSSSTRTTLFDERGQPFSLTNAQEKYGLSYTSAGAAELSPAILLRAARHCLTRTLALRGKDSTLKKISIAAVGASGFWHSLLGVDDKGRALTPIFTWADSRSTEDARQLRARLSERAVQQRTGCMLRASFWPAKLMWLRRTQRRLFGRVAHWVSPADWVYDQIFGTRLSSASMASATGLFNQKMDRWDEKLCAICGILLEQLPEVFRAAHRPEKGPRELQQARIFPAIGDGAASNLGSGAVAHGIAAITVGTSAAVRMVQPQDASVALPFGLFRYVVDRKRRVVGGAMSNGGNLRQWCVRELHFERDQALGRAAGARNSLTVLPFWVEERAPTWPDTQGGIIAGLTQTTTAADLYRAITTSVFNRIAEILSLLESHTGRARRIILSGGIVRSGASVRLLADILGRDVEICREIEASLRGAALHALEQIGCTPPALRRGRIVKHDARLTLQHRERRARQVALEKRLGDGAAAT